jgi:molybdopterin molybdotransferase
MKATVLESLVASRAGGQRKIDAWTATLRQVAVEFDDASAFVNANTLAELRGPAEMTARASLQEIASCVSGYDPKALPVAQAQEFIARLVPRVQAVEKVALRSALGRVLAEDVVSAIAVPSHDNSAMDGYALRGSELAAAAKSRSRSPAPASRAAAFDGAVAPASAFAS